MGVESLLASVAAPTAEYMQLRRAMAQQYALAEADPKVKAGYLTVEAVPWMAVPSEKT